MLFPTNSTDVFINFQDFEGLKKPKSPDAENKQQLELCLGSFSFPSRGVSFHFLLRKKRKKEFWLLILKVDYLDLGDNLLGADEKKW